MTGEHKIVLSAMGSSSLRLQPWQGDSPGSCHPHFYPLAVKEIPWPEEIAGTAEVVVVGAGLSGLTAAYQLRDRDVLVLEAGESIGGVCLSGSYQGVSYPAGSAYFYYPEDAAWQSWYRELGLNLAEALIPGPASALFYKGNWFPDCFAAARIRSLPLAVGAREGLLRLAADLTELEARWEPLGTEALCQPELDRYSLRHYLEEVRGLPREATHLLSPYCRSCLGAGPEAVSAWAGIFFLMSEFSPSTRNAAFPEGNARIARALAAALPRPPRLQHTLVRLAPKTDKVQLLIWDGGQKGTYRWEAGVVILATGKFVTRHLLSPGCGWEAESFQTFRYSSYLVAALCGAISLEAPGYENWVVGERALADFILTPQVPQAGEPRVLVAYAPQPFPEGRPGLLEARAEDKGRELLAALERLFPGMAREVREIRLYRFGHAQVVPYPGFLTSLKGKFPRQRGRIILAHSDLEGLPCIEAAIIQGQQAARAARAALAQ
jgi:oxygen-dependent protoporphyrinogen oxidase